MIRNIRPSRVRMIFLEFAACGVLIFTQRKIAFSKFILTIKGFDIADDIAMPLPKHPSNLQRICCGLAPLAHDDQVFNVDDLIFECRREGRPSEQTHCCDDPNKGCDGSNELGCGIHTGSQIVFFIHGISLRSIDNN